jgi:hypothetical protein
MRSLKEAESMQDGSCGIPISGRFDGLVSLIDLVDPPIERGTTDTE